MHLQACAVPLGSIDLRGGEFCLAADGKSNCFTIRTAERELQLRAESETALRSWCETLRTRCKEMPRTTGKGRPVHSEGRTDSDSGLSRASSDAESSEADAAAVAELGYTQKERRSKGL